MKRNQRSAPHLINAYGDGASILNLVKKEHKLVVMVLVMKTSGIATIFQKVCSVVLTRQVVEVMKTNNHSSKDHPISFGCFAVDHVPQALVETMKSFSL